MNANRESVRQCAAYFRENPAFARIMKELRQKYERYGHAAGTVVIKDASAAECEAARGIFGTPFSAPLKFKAAQFEDALQTTKFRGVSLREVLESYFGAEIKTKRERDAEAETRYCQMLRETRTDSETSQRWLEALERTNCSASQTLKRALSENEAAARLALRRSCQSMDWLERYNAAPVRLAVLASDAVSDPHALDRGTLCGNLFLQLLRFRRGGASPVSAEAGSVEQSDALYYENGILRDSVSSAVTQVGLILEEAETGAEHPAFAAFRMRHEICTLTLANLCRLSSARSPSGKAYVMENEMAFAQLCDDAARFHSPLICASGQPTTAVLRLLDMLSASGTELFYSGDFDGNGISIAARLKRRYPEHLRLWRMTPEDYRQCKTDVKLTEGSMQLLKNCVGLEEIAATVANDGHAGYQEGLISLLRTDLTEQP